MLGILDWAYNLNIKHPMANYVSYCCLLALFKLDVYGTNYLKFLEMLSRLDAPVTVTAFQCSLP